MDVNLATTTTLRMSPAKMEVQMVVRVTCTGPEDEGAVADTTFRDPKGGIKTTYGACPKPQRVASGTAIVNILHLGPEAPPCPVPRNHGRRDASLLASRRDMILDHVAPPSPSKRVS